MAARRLHPFVSRVRRDVVERDPGRLTAIPTPCRVFRHPHPDAVYRRIRVGRHGFITNGEIR
jgi:hypothetical protein